MAFEIISISEASSIETPIQTKDIEQVIKTQLSDLNDPDALSKSILEEVSKKSSKHKFIVQTTKIALDDTNVNLDISSKCAAAWEQDKDGLITVKLVKNGTGHKEKEVEKEKETTEGDSVIVEAPKRADTKDTIGGILDDYVTVEAENIEQYLMSIFYIFVG